MSPPQRAKPARKSARCGVVDGSPRPHPPHPQPKDSGPRLHAQKDEWSGVGERPTPDAPHAGSRRPPRAPSCSPHSAQSQLARARAVGLVTGPRARAPRGHSQWVVCPGRIPERTSGRGWESARPRAPRTQARGAPPRAPSCRPYSAPSQHARPARKSARGGVGDQPTPPHPTPSGARSPKPGRGKRDRAAPPPSKPNGARDRGRTRRGARIEWNGPTSARHRDLERCVRHTDPGRGQGGADTPRARAHTHTKDTRGKPEGQPNRARRTDRPHGMAYQRARIRDTQTGRPATHSPGNAWQAGGNREDTTPGTGPNPPEPAASAAHTRPGDCTCQGSSGAKRHTPAPGLGSLCASPQGSHCISITPTASTGDRWGCAMLFSHSLNSLRCLQKSPVKERELSCVPPTGVHQEHTPIGDDCWTV